MTDYKWRIIDEENANIELSEMGQGLANGENGPNNYFCGNCDYKLAKNIPIDMHKRLSVGSVRCPKCNKVNVVEWSHL